MSDSEFFAEAIIGWRGWRVKESGEKIVLGSLNGTLWEPNQWLEARCIKRSHKTPGEKCTCGIYAANTFAHLQKIGIPSTLTAFGEVWLAGEIVEGTAGYRAARAYPKCIYVPYTKWRWAKPLQAAYDVPVLLKNPYEGKEWRSGYRKRET